jgi:hypothetical protein
MKRRRFLFWISFGLFSLGERLRADGFDALAAAALGVAEPAADGKPPAAPVHWRAASNTTWRWYERENLVDGQWKLTGLTTPIHKVSGQLYTGHTGYLEESLVPAEIRGGDKSAGERSAGEKPAGEKPADDKSAPPAAVEPGDGKPDATRRAQHGQPPSKWLRSLHSDELRIWLKTIDVPEAGVEGMTFWEHLTRDHSFDPKHIAGLTIPEQAKLHAAAHYGY